MHDKFRPSWIFLTGLNRAGLISIGGLPKQCGSHRPSVMGLIITSADPRGSDVASYPLVCLGFQMSPNEIHQITDASVAGPVIKTILAR